MNEAVGAFRVTTRISEPLQVKQPATKVALLIRGDFNHFDDNTGIIGDEINQLARDRDNSWNKLFPEGDEFRPQAFSIRTIFQQGYCAYNTNAHWHSKVKPHFNHDVSSDRETRRFLRRFVLGIHEFDQDGLKIDTISQKIKSVLPRVKVKGHHQDKRIKIDESIKMADVCELILSGAISLDPETYRAH